MMLKKKLRRYFFAGLIVLLPVFLTINILFLTIRFFDNLFGKFINTWLRETFGISFFGIGLLAIIGLIFLAGMLTTNVLLNRIVPVVERFFIRVPLVSQIYPSLKQLVRFLFSEEKIAFKQVVIFEYPRAGVFTMGFITNEFPLTAPDGNSETAVSVYISSAPNPVTGFFVIVPKRSVTLLEMSIEEAFKIIISGGVLIRSGIKRGNSLNEREEKGAK